MGESDGFHVLVIPAQAGIHVLAEAFNFMADFSIEPRTNIPSTICSPGRLDAMSRSIELRGSRIPGDRGTPMTVFSVFLHLYQAERLRHNGGECFIRYCSAIPCRKPKRMPHKLHPELVAGVHLMDFNRQGRLQSSAQASSTACASLLTVGWSAAHLSVYPGNATHPRSAFR